MSSRYYRCIVADPPWGAERGAGKIKRGADRHYKLRSPVQILAIMRQAPLWRPASTGCHLWLWCTSSTLKDALWLMEALEFQYVSSAVWIKKGKFGLGQYLRHRQEYLLLGRMGRTMLPTSDRRPAAVIVAPRRGHSVKPDEAYAVVEAVTPGPRLEMFARRERSGWDCWGDELGDAER